MSCFQFSFRKSSWVSYHRHPPWFLHFLHRATLHLVTQPLCQDGWRWCRGSTASSRGSTQPPWTEDFKRETPKNGLLSAVIFCGLPIRMQILYDTTKTNLSSASVLNSLQQYSMGSPVHMDWQFLLVNHSPIEHLKDHNSLGTSSKHQLFQGVQPTEGDFLLQKNTLSVILQVGWCQIVPKDLHLTWWVGVCFSNYPWRCTCC